MFDPTLLARMQFAANITFHILFPTLTIGLGWFLVFFRFAYQKTRNLAWMQAYHAWTKIFALSFGLGVVSGITMSFQFGTNWPGFMEKVGNIAGPLLAYEVLTAFFLEAVFVGIMLFGFNRVSNRVHIFATLCVAVGTTLSAFWILALNSWMQTPTGHVEIEGVLHAGNWIEIIFNPSFLYRMTHMYLASLLASAFLILGVSAYQRLKKMEGDATALASRTALIVAIILTPLQIFIGDLHGLNTLEHQPQKVAAMEGNWDTKSHVPLILFAIPDAKTQTNKYEISIPNGASIILKHDAAGVVPGLKDYPNNHPPVGAVFYAFRIMVGVGLLMLIISWGVALKTRFGKQAPSRPLNRMLYAMTFSGWAATVAGWYVTEVGRQPWLVWGILKVKDAVSDVGQGTLWFSFITYMLVYAVLLWAYIKVLFYLARKMKTVHIH